MLHTIPLNTQTAWDQLPDQLCPRGYTGSSLVWTLAHARSIGAASCLVEEDYVDADYRDEHAAHYCRTYIQYPTLCQRVHFFACPANELEACLSSPGSLQDPFLGSVVLRPQEVGKVGRTVLRPPMEGCEGHECYTICIHDFPLHICGEEVRVTGAPFMEQDAMVVACAQCAMWVATTLLGAQFGYKHALPYEITTASLREALFLAGRILPAEGLNAWQILNGFSKLGYSAVPFFPEPGARWDPVAAMYPYVESGLPVIALVDNPGHAFAVVGHCADWSHSEDRAFKADSEPTISLLSAHSWVSGLIIHDDNIGPYSILPTSPRREVRILGNGFGDRLVSCRYQPRNWYTSTQDIAGLIVPLPERVYLTAESCINNLISILSSIRGCTLPVFETITASRERLRQWRASTPLASAVLAGAEAGAEDPCVVRLYLKSSSDYKAGLTTRLASMPAQIVEQLRRWTMPHYVWVAEISTRSRCDALTGEREILAEVVFDCTANKWASYPWVALHFPGLLVLQDRQQKFIPLPYSPASPFSMYRMPRPD